MMCRSRPLARHNREKIQREKSKEQEMKRSHSWVPLRLAAACGFC